MYSHREVSYLLIKITIESFFETEEMEKSSECAEELWFRRAFIDKTTRNSKRIFIKPKHKLYLLRIDLY